MRRFEFANQQQLAQRGIVACHEASHALVSYFYGERIGHIRLFDLGGGWWGGAHDRQLHPLARTATVFPECVAHRLLAGEIGARIEARMELDRIPLPLRDALRVRWYWWLAPVVERIAATGATDDAGKVLDLALQRHRVLWWHWVWHQHAWARAFVSKHINHVRNVAQALLSFTAQGPTGRFRNRPEWRVPGRLIFAALQRLDCPVRDASMAPIAVP